jgi:hypothetical protein
MQGLQCSNPATPDQSSHVNPTSTAIVNPLQLCRSPHDEDATSLELRQLPCIVKTALTSQTATDAFKVTNAKIDSPNSP